MARFLVEEEGRPTRSYRLITDAVIIGRVDTADLVLPDTSVSRKHALVERVESTWVLNDTGSANGTIVNGTPADRHVLAHNDSISVGKFLLRFQLDDEVEHPEYTDPSGAGGDFQTSPGEPLPEFAPPPPPPEVVPPVVAQVASATIAPEVRVVAPHLLGADAARYDVGEDGLHFGVDVPVRGVLPFGSAGRVNPVEGGAAIERGSLLIPVYVNGKSVKSARLKDGDELRIGSTRFTYHGP